MTCSVLHLAFLWYINTFMKLNCQSCLLDAFLFESIIVECYGMHFFLESIIVECYGLLVVILKIWYLTILYLTLVGAGSSPKRFRRDGIHERERSRGTGSTNLDNVDHMGRAQRHHHWLHDAFPVEASLTHDSKQEAGAVKKDSDKKSDDHFEAPKHASDPAVLPRPHSYFQHDERGSARQVGRRATGERGWRKDSMDQHNERTETTHSREQGDEKSRAKSDDNTSQRKDGPLPNAKKRPAFREKKIPIDPADTNLAPTEALKSSQTEYPPERNERRGERSANPRHLDRPEKQYAGDRATNKGEARRDDFLLRGRYGDSGGSSNYRGRDRFSGRQGYHPSKTRIEKWKHDLYQEVDKDPIPKNEDDQIAKLEALLAS